MENQERKVVSQSGATAIQMDLETIKLLNFDGKQRDWEVFKDKFLSMVIADSRISDSIKRARLDGCLKGNALKLIKGIQATADNFQVAWDALCRQFDNPKRRLAAQMEDLLQLPEASKESVKHINTLLCAVAVSVNVFKAHGRPVDQGLFGIFCQPQASSLNQTLMGYASGKGLQDNFFKIFGSTGVFGRASAGPTHNCGGAKQNYCCGKAAYPAHEISCKYNDCKAEEIL